MKIASSQVHRWSVREQWNRNESGFLTVHKYKPSSISRCSKALLANSIQISFLSTTLHIAHASLNLHMHLKCTNHCHDLVSFLLFSSNLIILYILRWRAIYFLEKNFIFTVFLLLWFPEMTTFKGNEGDWIIFCFLPQKCSQRKKICFIPSS